MSRLFNSEQFDFKDWELAFKEYYDKEKQFPNQVCLVISTHPHSSGYWIEPLNLPTSHLDFRYSGISVKELEDRVKKEIERATKQHRSPHLMY